MALAVLWTRARRRLGIITPRSPLGGGDVVGGVANSPVGRHSAGSSSRLPGRVTYLCPVGEVHTTVPSKTCPPATGSRWAADTPLPRRRGKPLSRFDRRHRA